MCLEHSKEDGPCQEVLHRAAGGDNVNRKLGKQALESGGRTVPAESVTGFVCIILPAYQEKGYSGISGKCIRSGDKAGSWQRSFICMVGSDSGYSLFWSPLSINGCQGSTQLSLDYHPTDIQLEAG